MNWLTRNLIGMITVSLIIVGSLIHNAVSIAVMETKITQLESVNKSEDILISDLGGRLSELGTTSAVTNQILSKLVESIDNFSRNTQALNGLVIRLDSRVNYFEKRKNNGN